MTLNINITYIQIIIDKKSTFDYGFTPIKSFTNIYQKSSTKQIMASEPSKQMVMLE